METQERTDTSPAKRGPGRPRKEQAVSEEMVYVLVEKPVAGRELGDQLGEMLAKGYVVDTSYKSRVHTRVMLPKREREAREARARKNRASKMVAHAAQHVSPADEPNPDFVRQFNVEKSPGALSVRDIGAIVESSDQ